MKLTTKSEYSIIALIYIARNQKKGYVKVEDICGEYNLSKKYLEHLLVSLRQAHFIKTKRGSSGGYALVKHPGRISVAEIVRLMDGALAPTLSVSKYFYEHTPLEKEKKVIAVFSDIRDYIAGKIERLKISDLV